LEAIAGQLGTWGYTAGIIVFISTCIYYLFKIMVGESELLELDTLVKLLDNFTLAIAVIIVAVPEGLPLSISIAMAFSIDTLMKENLLVK
jgi:magnesium-transporting ATPase (P-type)